MQLAREAPRASYASSRYSRAAAPKSLQTVFQDFTVYVSAFKNEYPGEYVEALKTIAPSLMDGRRASFTFNDVTAEYHAQRDRARTSQQVAVLDAAYIVVRRDVFLTMDLERPVRYATERRPPSPPLSMAFASQEPPNNGGGGGGGGFSHPPPRPPRGPRSSELAKDKLFAYLATHNTCESSSYNGDKLTFARVSHRDGRKSFRIMFDTKDDYGDNSAAFVEEVVSFFPEIDVSVSAEYEYRNSYEFANGRAVSTYVYTIETPSLELASYVVYYFVLAYDFNFDIPDDAVPSVRLKITFPFVKEPAYVDVPQVADRTVLPSDVLSAIRAAGLVRVAFDAVTLRNGASGTSRKMNVLNNEPFKLDTDLVHVQLGVDVIVINERDGSTTDLRVNLNDGLHRVVFGNLIYNAFDAATGGLTGELRGRRFEPVPISGLVNLDETGTALTFREGTVLEVKLPDGSKKQVLCQAGPDAEDTLPASCVYDGLREHGLTGRLFEDDTAIAPTDRVYQYAELTLVPFSYTGGKRKAARRSSSKRRKTSTKRKKSKTRSTRKRSGSRRRRRSAK